MKKTYITPESEIIKAITESHLLEPSKTKTEGTGEGGNTGGGVTTGSEGGADAKDIDPWEHPGRVWEE